MKRLIPCLLLAAALPLAAQLSLDSKEREGKPILINSDAMDVDIENGKATFYGNVVVDDPDVIITCKKMILYQDPKAKEEGKAKEDAKKNASSGAKKADTAGFTVEELKKLEALSKKKASELTKEESQMLEDAKKRKDAAKSRKKKDSNDPFAGENTKLERIECIDDVVITRKNTGEKSQRGTCGKAIYYHKEGAITMTISPVLHQDDSKITGTRLTFFRDSKRIEGTDIKITAKNLNDNNDDSKDSDKKTKKKKNVKKNADADAVDGFYNKTDSEEGDSSSDKKEEQPKKEVRKLSQKEKDTLLGLDKVPEKNK